MELFSYQYLVGCIILGGIWLIGYTLRKDLRKPMIISGVIYSIVTVALFLFWKICSSFINLGDPLIPSYWNPNTLLDLGRKTGGFSLEDVLFMLFTGGIAAFLYEWIFNKRIGKRRYRKHIASPIIGLLLTLLIQGFLMSNTIFLIINMGLIGAVIVWIGRKDLIHSSVLGGMTFVLVYFLAFLLFNSLFPHFIRDAYVLKGTTGIFLAGVPIEELFYALSFGLFWVPMYEYLFGVGDVKINPKQSMQNANMRKNIK